MVRKNNQIVLIESIMETQVKKERDKLRDNGFVVSRWSPMLTKYSRREPIRTFVTLKKTHDA